MSGLQSLGITARVDCRRTGTDEIRRRVPGWNVTDFGVVDFDATGLLLFTIRNGSAKEGRDLYAKDHCQKMLLDADNQVTPTRFHRQKMEDLVNLAGGNIVLALGESITLTPYHFHARLGRGHTLVVQRMSGRGGGRMMDQSAMVATNHICLSVIRQFSRGIHG